MSAPAAIYVADGDGYSPTVFARGAWDPNTQAGGAAAALLARELEREAGELGIVRLTCEFLKPIPLAPLTIATRVVRPGRRARLIEATLESAGTPVCRALGLALARSPESAPPVPPPRGEPLPPPEDVAPEGAPPGERPMFAGDAVEARFVRGALMEAGPGMAWLGLQVSLIEGETPSPLQRVTAAADLGSGVSSSLDWLEHVWINPDLTIYLARPARGEWVGLDSHTTVEADGVGLTTSVLHDAEGQIGHAVQALVVRPLGGPRA